jgi:hypothetical protein
MNMQLSKGTMVHLQQKGQNDAVRHSLGYIANPGHDILNNWATFS